MGDVWGTIKGLGLRLRGQLCLGFGFGFGFGFGLELGLRFRVSVRVRERVTAHLAQVADRARLNTNDLAHSPEEATIESGAYRRRSWKARRDRALLPVTYTGGSGTRHAAGIDNGRKQALRWGSAAYR